MKRVVISICLVLATAIVASAATYTYDGGYTTNLWRNAANWGGADYPGNSAANDVANINKSTAGSGDFPVGLKANLNYALGYLNMSDGDSSNPVTLEIDSGVTLTVNYGLTIGNSSTPTYAKKQGSGAITAAGMVISSNSANSNGDHATFQHSAGSLSVTGGALGLVADDSYDSEARLIVDATNLSPYALELYGGNSTSRECDLDINAAFSVTDNSGTDTGIYGFARVDVADGVTADFKDTWCGPLDTMTLTVLENSSGQFVANEFLILGYTNFNAITVTKEGAGTIDAGSFKITGQSSYPATFEVKAGSLETR